MRGEDKVAFAGYQQNRTRKEQRRKDIRQGKRLQRIRAYEQFIEAYKRTNPATGIESRSTKTALYSRLKARTQFPGHKRIKAPERLSFLQNTEAVLAFIEKLETCLNAAQKTVVLMEEVTDIQHDAIVVLLSIMTEFKKKGIDFNGTLPNDEKARKVFLESDFFPNLYNRVVMGC